MRFLWGCVLAICFVLVGLFTFDAISRIDGVFSYYPTQERQSAFLRNYSPVPVISRWAIETDGTDAGAGSERGEKFVPSEGERSATFVMDSEKNLPLMNALRDDIAAQLLTDGATILSRSGDAGSGFRFAYRIGSNEGLATLLPLTIDRRVMRNRPLPDGEREFDADIRISEKWVPREAEAIQASLATR